MHEVGIMEGALDMARRLMEENGGSRLLRLHMTIGSLSGVVPDALQSAFLALKDAYAAGNAVLEVTWVEALCRCDDCQENFLFTDHGYICPGCGSPPWPSSGGGSWSLPAWNGNDPRSSFHRSAPTRKKSGNLPEHFSLRDGQTYWRTIITPQIPTQL